MAKTKQGCGFRQFIGAFAAVVYFFILGVIFPCCWILTICLLLYGNFFWRTLMLLYIFYIHISSAKFILNIEGNGSRYMRSNWFWKQLRRYFPIELVKTVDLPANRHYILANFPHGVVAYGCTINISFDIDNWLALFPGIRPKQGILNATFLTPFFHEYLRFSGFISVSEKSLMHYLTSCWQGDGFTSNGVCIVVGGAQEALDSRPGQNEVTFLRRKGFVRLAIKSGAAIVPCFTFGEVDSFERWDGKWILYWQLLIKYLLGISMALVKGRGGFPIPFKRRIVQVVGKPIEVQKNDCPQPEYVEEIHQKVVESLKELFETHKINYIENHENVKLVIK